MQPHRDAVRLRRRAVRRGVAGQVAGDGDEDGRRGTFRDRARGGGEPACVDACATRPEMNNAGKQYVRAPVLFHTDTAGYRAVLQDKPERKDEVGMMQAMLEAGTVSSAA